MTALEKIVAATTNKEAKAISKHEMIIADNKDHYDKYGYKLQLNNLNK